jgi:tetratricopeptide (TPR) repeat protein
LDAEAAAAEICSETEEQDEFEQSISEQTNTEQPESEKEEQILPGIELSETVKGLAIIDENAAEELLEEKQPESNENNIDSYIDEAFKFKQNGDYESAIIYYMYALDSKPENSLVFWIILDICVLYKEMGQAELARQILEGYVEIYGNVMDKQVKDEIERNLI